MPVMIPPSCHFPVHDATVCTASRSLTVPFACCVGFWSMFTLMVLNSEPVYAEWVEVNRDDNRGIISYTDPATIRREGNLVRVWELLDYKNAQIEKGISHLSTTAQLEFDCVEVRYRLLTLTQYSENMGRGQVLLTNSHQVTWTPVEPETLSHSLWTSACNKE